MFNLIIETITRHKLREKDRAYPKTLCHSEADFLALRRNRQRRVPRFQVQILRLRLRMTVFAEVFG